MSTNLSIFFFCYLCFGVLFFFLRNHSLSQGYIPHAYFPMSCISSLIYFELIFYIWWDIGVQFHPFPCGYPVVLVLFDEGIILFPSSNYSGMLVKNEWAVNVRIYSGTLNSIPWNSMSIPICWNHTVSWGAVLGPHALTQKLKRLLICPQLRLSINGILCSR